MRCAIFQIYANILVIYQKIYIFTQETLYPSFISKKKISALQRKRLSKHPLFTTFLLLLTVSELCNISNKRQLPNKSAQKVFYTRYLTLFLHAIKKFALSIAESFRNIHFSPNFYQFSQWMRCGILQINLQVIQQNINIFAQQTLCSSFISKNNWCSLSQTFFEESIFYHIFTIFESE